MTLRFRHLLGASLLHVVLLLFLFSGVQCSRRPQPVTVIQGALIRPDQIPLVHPAAPAIPAPAPSKPEPPPPPPAPPPKPQPTPPAPPPAPDPAVIERQRAAEAAKLAAEKAAVEKAAAAKAAAEKAAVEKAAVEKAALAKKQAEAEAARQKAAEEAAERARDEAKKKAAEEAQRKAAAAEEARRKAAAKAHAEAQRQREAELAVALGAESEQRTQADVNLWATQLVAAIQRVWTRPPGLDQNLSCLVNIQLSPTGQVLSASIKSSSGNALFDDSVVRAAYKASPLPLPNDPTAFQPSLNVTFTPGA